MALLLSVVVTAVGAFLLWGVDRSIGGVNANTIGAILVVLGAIGALLSRVLRSRSSRYVDCDYDDDERLTTRPR